MGGPIIAAIAAGSFFGLVLIGVALYFLCFKKPDGESYRTNDKSHLDDEGEVSNQTVKVKAGHQDHNYHMVASTLKSENDEKKYFENHLLHKFLICYVLRPETSNNCLRL